MHEKNIALLCDEADRLLQLNIDLLRQMVDEPDVLSDSKNENGLLFDKRKALKRIEELEGEQIKTARREMVLAAGRHDEGGQINHHSMPLWGRKFCPTVTAP